MVKMAKFQRLWIKININSYSSCNNNQIRTWTICNLQSRSKNLPFKSWSNSRRKNRAINSNSRGKLSTRKSLSARIIHSSWSSRKVKKRLHQMLRWLMDLLVIIRQSPLPILPCKCLVHLQWPPSYTIMKFNNLAPQLYLGVIIRLEKISSRSDMGCSKCSHRIMFLHNSTRSNLASSLLIKEVVSVLMKQASWAKTCSIHPSSWITSH